MFECVFQTMKLPDLELASVENVAMFHCEANSWSNEDQAVENWQFSSCPDWWSSSFVQWVVLDANSILDHFEGLQFLSTLQGVNIVVPRMVLEELEGLGRLGAEAELVTHALEYLQPRLRDDNRCEATSAASAFILPAFGEAKFDNPLQVSGLHLGNNDQILACARYFAEMSAGMLTLLTDDRVLAIKASACDLSVESMTSFAGNMAMLQCEAMSQQSEQIFTTGFGAFELTSPSVTLPPGLCEMGTENDYVSHLVPKVHDARDSAGSSTAEGEGGTEESTASAGSTTEGEVGTEESTSSECASPRSDVILSSRDDSDMGLWRPKRCGDKEFIVLRGLPFTVTEAEVLDFAKKSGVRSKDLQPSKCVSLLANAEGRPSGFAEIRLSNSAAFADVFRRLHMKYLGDRYIEALPPKSGNKSRSNRRWRRKLGKW